MPREGDHGHSTRQSLGRVSLSGDLLGKFSAIVRPRRASQAGDNNVSGSGGGGDLPILDHSSDHDDPSLSDSDSATPSSKAFGFMRRFSRATTSYPEDHSGGPLRRMLDYDEFERQRRFDLETMSFAHLHEQFGPQTIPEAPTEDVMADDNQVEEELQRAMEDHGGECLRRKSRETTTDADEYEAMLQSQASSSMDEDDDDDDDHHDASERLDDDDGELNFDDPLHMGASVRKLVRQIENASFHEDNPRPDASIASGASGASNQDDEDHGAPALEPTADEAYAARHSEPLVVDVKPPPRRTTYPVVPAAAYRPPRPFLSQGCYIPMDEVQEDLTKSVRRLVIGLKQEAEAQDEAQPSALPFVRRRGNSCPAPYCRPAPAPAANPTKRIASIAPPAVAPPPVVSMDMGPTEPPRWRKRSTLARLAPKFLDTFRRKRQSYLYTDEELESIEGARWKIVELAFRFGGKHRAYLVQAVNMFFPLIKYGRHGGPHATRLHCNRCGTLQWQHKRGGLSDAVDLADVLQIIEGRQTAVFRKYVSCPELDSRSLSLVFKERTLDLETQSSSHRDWLMSALRTLVTYAKRQRDAESRALAERALLPLEDLGESSSSLSRSRVELLARMTEPPPRNGTNVAVGSSNLLW